MKPDHRIKTLLVLFLLTVFVGANSVRLTRVQAAGFPPPPEKPDSAPEQPGVGPAEAAKVDNFGYSLDDSQTPHWFDATSQGIELNFPTQDDEVVGPVEIGFEFPYYENAYSQLFVSTNGLLTLGIKDDKFSNQKIPRDTTPDNFIAPFWDDLILLVAGDGQKISRVYYQQVEEGGEQFFVVEWLNVAKLGSQDLLSFEALLYPNGDILVQYHDLNGIIDEATVGIEDEHGVDGLMYLYNAPGLLVDRAIKFTRPGKTYRAKVFPSFRSAFTAGGTSSLNLALRNAGEQGTDSYSLSWTPSDPLWEMSIYRFGANQPLPAGETGTLFETGPIAQGETLTLTIRLKAPATAQVGDFVRGELAAISDQDSSHKATTILQAAIPAPFGQALFEDRLGMRLQFVWKENQISARISENQFTGSNFSVVQTASGNYIYSWERNGRTVENNVFYSNLEYVVLNHFGNVIRPISQIVDNDSPDLSLRTEDRVAALTGIPAGPVGVVWVHKVSQDFVENGQTVQKVNYNLRFSVLGEDGAVIVPPIQLTQNEDWKGKNDLDVPSYNSPRVAGTDDNRFVISWVDERLQSEGDTADLNYAVFDQSGNPVSQLKTAIQGVPGSLRYISPSLVSLSGHRVLLAYVKNDIHDPDDLNDDVSTTGYLVLDTGGNVVKPAVEIPDSAGSTPDGVQLSSGPVLLAWNVVESDQVQAVVLDGETYTPVSAVQSLSTPKGRRSSEVSVTKDGNGHGIITWEEAEQSNYFCYTLIDANGSAITPPMIYDIDPGSELTVITNSYGFGNAPYEGFYQVFLPIARR
jgi:hypothetical protein